MEELFQLAERGNLKISGLLNKKSKAFKDLKIDPDSLSEEETAQILSENPKAIIRPLLTDGKKLTAGFKPDEMENLLS